MKPAVVFDAQRGRICPAASIHIRQRLELIPGAEWIAVRIEIRVRACLPPQAIRVIDVLCIDYDLGVTVGVERIAV